MKRITLTLRALAVVLLFSTIALYSCKDDDAPKVFGVVSAKMIAGDGRSYNCVVEGDRLINSADSMKMGTDLSAISLEIEASMGTEMYYNNAPLTKETVLDLTSPVTIQARNGGDIKSYRVEAVIQTMLGAKVTSDMTATGLPKFHSYDMAYFRFLSVRLNRLKNKLLANYLRNRGNDLATVRNSAFCVAILSNNSFICKYNIFFRKYELLAAIL